MISKFEEYIKYNESSEFTIDINVDDKDDNFINDLVDNISFVYKKRKDKHVRPLSITGRGTDGNVKLDIKLSNKDKLHIRYKHNDELKVKINDDVVYHMDDVKSENLLKKIYDVYSKYLKNNNFKIKDKNPFECLSESLLDKLEGPSKEEVFKNIGYNRENDTPESFFEHITDGIRKLKIDGNLVYWGKNNKIILGQNTRLKDVYVDYKSIWIIYENVFNMSDDEIKQFILKMVKKYLNWNESMFVFDYDFE